MAFLSSETIKERLVGRIDPFDASRIKHGAYELSLGREVYLTTEESKKILPEREQVVIHPGQFALLLTEEEVFVPKDLIAFISIKAGIKFRGLINVSGFHVDPGFKGHLKFSVYNAGSRNIVLHRGQPLFLIWFAQLDRETTDAYSGVHAGQKEISDNDVMKIQGDIISPSAIKEKIDDLQRQVDKLDNRFWVAITLSLLLIASIIGAIIKSYL